MNSDSTNFVLSDLVYKNKTIKHESRVRLKASNLLNMVTVKKMKIRIIKLVPPKISLILSVRFND